jgi:hypothetical protein
VVRILAQAHAWLNRHGVAVERCAARYDVDVATIRAVILIAAGLHDTAKLSVNWQRAVAAWQAHKSGVATSDLLAHTDFDPAIDGEIQRQPEFRRPNHAVEGSVAVLLVVDHWIHHLGCRDDATGDCLRRIVLSAIARHHSPSASSSADFSLVPNAADTLLSPFGDVPGLSIPSDAAERLIRRPTADHRLLWEQYSLLAPGHPHHAPFFPLYSFVVRGLRLADQAATRQGTEAAQQRVSA